MIQLQARATTEELNAYASAANVVEEVLGGIRTVFAFGGEKDEVDRYKRLLIPTNRATRRKGLFSSISDGIPRLLFFVSCALSFWFGIRWVLEDRDKINKSYTSTDLITVCLFDHHYLYRLINKKKQNYLFFFRYFSVSYGELITLPKRPHLLKHFLLLVARQMVYLLLSIDSQLLAQWPIVVTF